MDLLLALVCIWLAWQCGYNEGYKDGEREVSHNEVHRPDSDGPVHRNG
jgi:hypothetical protein